MAEETIKFEYEIAFQNGGTKKFLLELDPGSLGLLPCTGPQKVYPEWTRLTCHQCPVCPLDLKDHPQCPVAANLLEVTNAFSKNISYEEVSVTIRTKPRNYQRNISLQDALRSMFGIYMATSNCPILDKLRPLVLTHLPFATGKETFYRVLTMYVLAQLFIQQKGGKPDWELKNLAKMYEDVEVVNRAFHQRLVSAGFADAALNAVTNLDCYAQFAQLFLEPERFKEIESLFLVYLRDLK